MEVDIQPQRSVEFAQLLIGLFSCHAIIARHTAYHLAIALFDKALVVFLLWSPTGKRQVFSLAIDHQVFVDKFRAIIGVNAQKRKRERGASAF